MRKMRKRFIFYSHVLDYHILNMRYSSWLCLHAMLPPSFLIDHPGTGGVRES
jgi:hypothetical protein